MLPGPGVGDDPARGNGPVTQGPKELLVPLVPLVGLFDLGQGPRHALIGVIDRLVDDSTILCLESVLLVPDVLGGSLDRDLGGNAGQSPDLGSSGHVPLPRRQIDHRPPGAAGCGYSRFFHSLQTIMPTGCP